MVTPLPLMLAEVATAAAGGKPVVINSSTLLLLVHVVARNGTDCTRAEIRRAAIFTALATAVEWMDQE